MTQPDRQPWWATAVVANRLQPNLYIIYIHHVYNIEGGCILLRTACEADLHMADSLNELTQFPVWPLAETATGVLYNCILGALPEARRDTILPLVRSEGSPPRTNDIPRSPAVTDRRKTENSTLVA